MKMISLRRHRMALLLLVALQYISYVNAGENILEEQFVNSTSIIARTPFTTITSCVMKCSAHHTYSAVGFSDKPAMDRKLECLHLIDAGKNETIGDSRSFVKIFVLANPTTIVHSYSPATNCSRFSSTTVNCSTSICSSYTLFPAVPHEIKKNTIIGTMEKWYKVNRVRFKVKIDVSRVFVAKYYTIIRFAQGLITNNMAFGSRIPFVYLQRRNNEVFVISVVYWVNKAKYSGNLCTFDENRSFFTDWFIIDISQTLIDKQYKVVIKVGDKIRQEFVNTEPMEFHDVKMYAGDAAHDATGMVKDLVVEGFSSLKINGKKID